MNLLNSHLFFLQEYIESSTEHSGDIGMTLFPKHFAQFLLMFCIKEHLSISHKNSGSNFFVEIPCYVWCLGLALLGSHICINAGHLPPVQWSSTLGMVIWMGIWTSETSECQDKDIKHQMVHQYSPYPLMQKIPKFGKILNKF